MLISRRSSPFPIPKSAVRTAGGQSAPRPRKAPVFSTYSSRIVSATKDYFGIPESFVAATCFVTRSQPIVAPTARTRTKRVPILAIPDLIDNRRCSFIYPSTIRAEPRAAGHITTDIWRVGSSTWLGRVVTTAYDKTMDLNLTAVFQKVPEGYIGFVEELPGANTQGATLEEARANLQEAVAMVLEANRDLIDETTQGGEVIREPLKVGA